MLSLLEVYKNKYNQLPSLIIAIILQGIKFKRDTISVRNDNKCNILFNVIVSSEM